MPPRTFYLEPRLSDYLEVVQAYASDESEPAKAFISESDLPYISSLEILARYVGVEGSLIRQILHKPSYHYRHFTIPKKDGTGRQISTPRTYLKVIQWWLLDNVISRIPLNEAVHGFRRGYSYISNATFHLGQRHLLNVDIKDYFPSITTARVSNLFSRLGYSPEISQTLANLLTLRGSLPQGSPCSPGIANIVFERGDCDLQKYADAKALRYSRYADDITISSSTFIPNEVLADITKIISVNGFNLNDRKTRFVGPGNRTEVTGIILSNSLNLPRQWRYRAKAIFHQAKLDPARFVDRIDEVRGLYGVLHSLDVEDTKKITRMGLSAITTLTEYLQNREQNDH